MGEVLIRQLATGDLETVLRLLVELNDCAHAATTLELERIQESFAHMQKHDEYKNFVALVADQVVGLLSMVYYKSFYHRGGTALINELVVSESFRGRGVGRDIVEHAIEISRADGMDEIEVGTEKSNLGAMKFYRKVGFKEEYVLLGNEFDSDQGADSK